MAKRAKYVGPHDAVLLPDLIDPETGETPEVQRGQLTPSYASDEFVTSLLDQPANWEPHPAPKAPAAAPTATPDTEE